MARSIREKGKGKRKVQLLISTPVVGAASVTTQPTEHHPVTVSDHKSRQ